MYRVLYVDDEPDLLELAKLFLEESGEFTIITSTSATEVLAAGDLSSVDAIISDYQMPKMDGITFLKEVRAGFVEIPFILFTGKGREEVVIEALNSGADFYLQKGGDPTAQFAELVHKIRMAIERRETKQQIIVQNRLYSVLSAINKAIVHIRNKSDFFSEICRILVEIGGFRMVWIGLAVPLEKKIKPVASCGHTDGYLDVIQISTEDVPLGRGPTGTAYRKGTYNFLNDIMTDPQMEPWRDAALQRGYLANAAFPFGLGTPNAGVISLYAPEKGFFSKPVLTLLEELSRDISFALVTIDIEERRNSAEELLRDSEEKFRIISENSPDHIIIHDLDLRYVYVLNPQLGLKSEDMIGKTDYDFLAKEDADKLTKIKRQVLDSGTAAECVTRLINLQGTLEYFEGSYIPRFDRNGTCEGLVGYFRNITGRTLAEKALKESEKEYRELLETLNEGVWVIDQDSVTTFVNPKMEEILGYLPGEMLGKSLYSFMDDEGRRIAANNVERRKQGIKEQHDFEFIKKDGMRIYTTLEATPIFGNNGEYLGAIAGVSDITERKQAEDALRESEKKARNLSSMLRLMCDNVPDMIWAKDLEKCYTFANKAICSGLLNAADTDEPVGHTDLFFAERERNRHPGDHSWHMFGEKSRDTDQATLDAGCTQQFDEYGNIQGKFLYLDVRKAPLIDENGNTIGTVGSARDMTECKQAEETRKTSETSYRGLFNTIEQAIYILNSEGKFVDVNDGAVKMYGYSRDEFIGKTPEFLAAPGKNDIQGVTEKIRTAFNGESQRLEFWGLRKNGQQFPKDVYLYPGTYFSENIIIAVGADITERKQAEEALRESERKFSTVFLANPVSLTLVSAIDGIFVDVNNAFLRNTGYTRKEVIGKTSDELGLFPDMNEYREMVSCLRGQRLVNGVELHVQTKNGVIRTSRFSSSIITMGGKPHILSTVEDITERRNAEDALKESEERFRSLVYELQDSVIILGFDGTVLFANPAACQLVGIDIHGLDLPTNILPFIDPGSVQKVIADLKIIGDGTSGVLSKYRICTVSGEKKWIEASGTRINYQGNFADLVAIRDITKSEEAERALHEANKKLQLLGSITRHDILNKITVSLGYIALMKKKSADPVVQEYCTKLESAAKAIGSQITFTKVYQDLGTHEPQWQDLDAVLPRAHVPETISLNADVPGFEICADPMLEKVFFNLLDNSIRHGEHVTEITLSSIQSGDILTVVWEDNGVGIPADEKEKIFERGFGKNTGLGMFLVREVLSLTGITIKETGELGKGARFEIVVPGGSWRFPERYKR